MRSLCLIIVRVAWPASFILDILRAMNIARGSVPARVAVLTILSPLFASSLLVCLGRDPGAERGRRASRGRRVEESGREEVDLGGGGGNRGGRGEAGAGRGKGESEGETEGARPCSSAPLRQCQGPPDALPICCWDSKGFESSRSNEDKR